jgi:hypothetical protein
MMKELFDEILIRCGIRRTLEHSRKKYTFLSIYRQNLISTIPMKTSNLDRRYTKRDQAGAFKADSFVAPGFVYKDKSVVVKGFADYNGHTKV